MTAPPMHALPKTATAKAFRLPEIAVPALLVVLGFTGHFAVPSTLPYLRAVLVLPAVLWVPGRCALSRTGIPAAAGRHTAALAVLASIIILIVASLGTNLVLGHVPLGTLPLWISLAALPLCRMRPVSAEPGGTGSARGLLSAVGFVAGLLAVAGTVAAANHYFPGERQPGFLAFSFDGDYAGVPGVVRTQAGGVLDVPVAVTASQQDLTGLTVTVTVDGKPVPGAQVVPVSVVPAGANGATGTGSVTGVTGSGQGYVHFTLTVPKTCLSRYSFALDRQATQLRQLDLYVSTDDMAACGGK